MSVISQPTKRIEYIDALRGFTMILVVFSHVEMTSLGFETPTFLNSMFMSFRMPLFFFISGFIRTWNNVVLELFVGVAVSLLVICVCLLISNILRTSSILAQYLFGVKAKK